MSFATCCRLLFAFTTCHRFGPTASLYIFLFLFDFLLFIVVGSLAVDALSIRIIVHNLASLSETIKRHKNALTTIYSWLWLLKESSSCLPHTFVVGSSLNFVFSVVNCGFRLMPLWLTTIVVIPTRTSHFYDRLTKYTFAI